MPVNTATNQPAPINTGRKLYRMLVQQRFRTTELTDWYHRPDNFYVMNNILRQLIKKQTANMQSVFLLQEVRSIVRITRV